MRGRRLRVLTPEAAAKRGVLAPEGGPWNARPDADSLPDAEHGETLLCGSCGTTVAIHVRQDIRLVNAAIKCPSCGAINDADITLH